MAVEDRQVRIPLSVEELMAQYLEDSHVVDLHGEAIGASLFPDDRDRAEAASWHASWLLHDVIFQAKPFPADLGAAVLDRMQAMEVSIDG